MKMGDATFNSAHCTSCKDLSDTDDGFTELSAINGAGMEITQNNLYYTLTKPTKHETGMQFLLYFGFFRIFALNIMYETHRHHLGHPWNF